jgi:hypothetical protein
MVEAGLPDFERRERASSFRSTVPVVNPVWKCQVTEQVEVQQMRLPKREPSASVRSGNRTDFDLPLNGRQVTDLISAGGATRHRSQRGVSAERVCESRCFCSRGLNTGLNYISTALTQRSV